MIKKILALVVSFAIISQSALAGELLIGDVPSSFGGAVSPYVHHQKTTVIHYGPDGRMTGMSTVERWESGGFNQEEIPINPPPSEGQGSFEANSRSVDESLDSDSGSHGGGGRAYVGIEADIAGGQALIDRMQQQEQLKKAMWDLVSQLQTAMFSEYGQMHQNQINKAEENLKDELKDSNKDLSKMTADELLKWANSTEDMKSRKDSSDRPKFNPLLEPHLTVKKVTEDRGGDPHNIVPRAFKRAQQAERDYYKGRLASERKVTKAVRDAALGQAISGEFGQLQQDFESAGNDLEEGAKDQVKNYKKKKAEERVKEGQPPRPKVKPDFSKDQNRVAKNLQSTYSRLEKAKAASPQQARAKELGFENVRNADRELNLGNVALASEYSEIAKTLADVAVGLDPVTGTARDIYEAVSGTNFVTGEKLSGVERGVAVVGAITGGLASKGFRAGRALTRMKVFQKLAKSQKIDSLVSYAQKLNVFDREGANKLARSVFSKKASPFELETTHGITMSRKQFKKLRDSLESDGIMRETVKYVEYQGKKYIVDGHHRVRAAKEIGMDKVPVERVQLPFKGYNNINDLFNRGQ